MTKENKKLLTGVLIGIGVLMFIQSSRTAPLAPQYQNIPPQPSRTNKEAWFRWAKQVMDLYNQSRSLWQPGGPFYNGPSASEILDGFQWATRGF